MQDLEYLALYAAEHRLQEQRRRSRAGFERGRESRAGLARSTRLVAQRIRASRWHAR